MPILTRAAHPLSRPFVRFALLPKPLPQRPWEWPYARSYEHAIVLELGDGAIGALCGIARMYSPWRIHDFTQISRPCDLARHAAQMTRFIRKIECRPAADAGLRDFLFLYDGGPLPKAKRTTERLRRDLIDSLLLLRRLSLHAAATGQTLAIVGF